MKKNLLDKESGHWMVQRIQDLQVDTLPRWGRMTATEMLLHLNKSHQFLLAPAPATCRPTSFRQLLIRWLVLYVMPRYPKGAKAPQPLQTKGAIDNSAFEEQKKLFVALIRQFAQHKDGIRHYHPYFGALDTKQWGLTCWKHTDHHLRQFGL